MTVSPLITVEQVLDQARRLLADPEAWYQGDLFNENRSAFCSLGAIVCVCKQLGANIAVTDAASTTLRTVLCVSSIVRWNDDNKRQHSEVVEAFEKARAYAGENGL